MRRITLSIFALAFIFVTAGKALAEGTDCYEQFDGDQGVFVCPEGSGGGGEGGEGGNE